MSTSTPQHPAVPFPYSQVCNPRNPSDTEVVALFHFLRDVDCEPAEQAGGMIAQARIAVFDHYISDCPGYTGPVMVVVWSGGPDCTDVFVRDTALLPGHLHWRREKQQREWAGDRVRLTDSQPRRIERLPVPDHEVPPDLVAIGENDRGTFYLDPRDSRVYFNSVERFWTLSVILPPKVSREAEQLVHEYGVQGSDWTRDQLLNYIAKLEAGLE